jgi:hypothetical protein
MKLGPHHYIAEHDFEKAHFPIVVSGIVERCFFRKSKQEEETKGWRKDSALLNVLGDPISSLADVANNGLTQVNLLRGKVSTPIAVHDDSRGERAVRDLPRIDQAGT